MNTQTYKAFILGFLAVASSIVVWTYGLDFLYRQEQEEVVSYVDVEQVTVPSLGAHFSQQQIYAAADIAAVIKKDVPVLRPSAPIVEDAQELSIVEPKVEVALEFQEVVKQPTPQPEPEPKPIISDLDSWELTPTWSIAIPSLNISAPVLLPSGKFWNQRAWTMLEEQMQVGLNNGSVAYPHSAAPGGVGNLIIAGHSSPPDEASAQSAYGHLFAKLPEIAIGDEVTVSGVTYRIDDKFVVSPSEVSILAQQDEESMLKLITCYPVGTTKNRMIIVGKKVEE